MPGKKKRKKKASKPAYSGKEPGFTASKVLAPVYKSLAGLYVYFQKYVFHIVCLALIIIVGVVAYSNSLNAPFVFDDEPNIAGNKAIVGLESAVSDNIHTRAVGYLSFALNYKVNSLDVTGYHVVNLAVHLTTALLVFWLVLLTFKTPFLEGSGLGERRFLPLLAALFAGLVFVAHPLQTQAVTYTVQRFTSLATLLYLLSLVLYAKWRLAGDEASEHKLFGHNITAGPGVKKGFLCAGSLAAALLAMLTKEIAFTLPFVIALWEFAFLKGGARKRIIRLLPFALMLPVIPLILALSDIPLLSAAGTEETPPASDYFNTQLRVIVTYLRLFFFPLGQHLDYDFPVYLSFLDPNVLLSFIFLLAIAALGVFLWRYSRKGGDYTLLRLAAFGIFWFFVTLSVESSVIAIADVIFEHRLYLPSIGLIIATVAVVAFAIVALKERLPWINRIVLPLAAAVVIAMAVATYERNQVWGSPITLLEDSTVKSPYKARAHNNLGHQYQEENQQEKAAAEFRQAIELKPDYPDANRNLGVIYANSKQYEEAIYYLRRAVELDPEDFKAHSVLGYIYFNQQRYDLSYEEYMAALRIRPDDSTAKKNVELLKSKMQQSP